MQNIPQQQILQKKPIEKKPVINPSPQQVQKPVSLPQQKHSHKVKQKKNNKENKGNINDSNPRTRPDSTNGNSGGGVSHKVSFNFKNNKVDKFYCRQLAIARLTKSRPIDLESIPDLPEIPLDKLFGAQ